MGKSKKVVSSSSSDSSSSDSEPVAKPVKKVVAAKAAAPAPAPAAKAKVAAKKVVSESSDSDSSSEDEAPAKPVAKAAAAAPKRKAAESSDSSDSDSSSEEEAAKPAAATKKAKAAEAPVAAAAAPADDNCAVFVKGIPFDSTEEVVRELFEGCGTISAFSMPVFEDSGRCRGMANITYGTAAEATAALELNGHDMGGRILSVEKSQPRAAKPAWAATPSDKEPSLSCFIGNLSWEVTEDGVREAFADCGEIVHIRFATDRETGDMRGFGHMEFTTLEAAKAAVAKTGTDVCGRAIRVDFAAPRAEGGGGGGGRGGGRGGFGDRGGRGGGGFRGGRGGGFGDRGGRGGGFRGGGRGGFGDRGGRGGSRGGFGDRKEGIKSFEGKKMSF